MELFLTDDQLGDLASWLEYGRDIIAPPTISEGLKEFGIDADADRVKSQLKNIGITECESCGNWGNHLKGGYNPCCSAECRIDLRERHQKINRQEMWKQRTLF